jgi:hypothetical protein
LLDRLGAELDVEGVLSDLPRYTRYFYRTPHKYVLIVLEEVDELPFLFRV